jgi:hypothetical protein
MRKKNGVDEIVGFLRFSRKIPIMLLVINQFNAQILVL